MGNPAMVKRKKTEKRRKKYETRLGAGAYLPKDERLQVNATVAKVEAEEKARKDKVKKDRETKKATEARARKLGAKPAAKPADAPPAEEKK
jgi:hypothetical protein